MGMVNALSTGGSEPERVKCSNAVTRSSLSGGDHLIRQQDWVDQNTANPLVDWRGNQRVCQKMTKG